MKKVIIASKNPVKINAVKKGFKKMFPNETFEFTGVSVSSEVSDQPLSNNETFKGASNRAQNAKQQYIDATYWVGIEGGIQPNNEEMEAFAWIVIKSNLKTGKSRTGTFFLPTEIVKLINKGLELGEADDIVFNKSNSKQENGAVGLLTNNIIDRTSYYLEAVILALIPFKNEQFY
ncbi:inosine/xanthosine triphosphatase [Lutibacter citreus]|uniref:inosine/xanthosine triphosphatase n=1 Tax=Lutibacter citreus TaxID=2138210 RepID=UPI000DBE3590|nr:inosine/xanthosine triphosphatase [Lutibacter citreus]